MLQLSILSINYCLNKERRFKFMKKKISLIVAALAACSMGLVSCGEDTPTPSPTPTPAPSTVDSVVSVTITGAPASIKAGETAQLGVDVVVTGNAAKTVTWSASNAFGTVDANGLFTAKAQGAVIVTARSTVDAAIVGTVTINVTVDPAVKSVSISGAPSTMYIGGKADLKATVEVVGIVSKEVKWSSDKPAVIDVNSSGHIEANSVGTATIKATSVADPTKYKEVTIEVVKKEWPSADAELMEEAFGEVLPCFDVPSGSEWVDYTEDYNCISLEVDGDKTSAINTAIKSCDDYEYVGVDDYGDPVYHCDSVDPDYYFYVNVYYDSDYEYTSVDVYKRVITYTEWPTEAIKEHLEAVGLNVELPAFASEDEIDYSVSFEDFLDEEEEPTGEKYVLISALGEDTDATPDDYVALLDAEKFDIEYSAEDSAYIVRAKDKSCMLEVFEDYYYYGFNIAVSKYIADYSLEIEEQYQMLAVGETLPLTVYKGYDVGDVAFKSSNEEVATVSDEGVVTAVTKGEVTITASYGEECEASTVVYVEDSIPTEYTAEQLAEFKKIDDVEGIYPTFSKYVKDVKYVVDEEQGAYAEVTGKVIGADAFEEYYQAMVADGWEDANEELYAEIQELYFETYFVGITLDEARAIAYEYYGFYGLTKEFDIDTKQYLVTAEICLYDEEGEIAIESGELNVIVYDDYFYDYAQVVTYLNSGFEYYEVEVAPAMPTELAASRYDVQDAGGSIVFYAFNCSHTLSSLKSEFEGLGYTLEQVDVPATKDEEAYSYLEGVAQNGETAVQMMVEDGELIVLFRCVNEVELDFTKLTDLAGEVDGVSYKAEKASGTSAPATSSSSGPFEELRLYANNTFTVSCESGLNSIEIVCNTCTCTKAGAELTCNVGTMEETATGYIWTAPAEATTSVVFTAIRVGSGDAGKQCHVTYVYVS